MAVLVSEWLYEQREDKKNKEKDSQWDCEVCKKKKLWTARNCEGKGPKTKIKVLDQVFEQCPIALVDDESFELVSIINQCEGGGFGSSRISPQQYLDETAFYMNVRAIVLGEQMRIQRWKDK